MRSHSLFCGSLLFGCSLAACPAASAQGQWSELPPGERFAHAAAFDPVAHDLVVVGGFTNEGVAAKVLRFELNGDPYWFEVATTGEPPPLRGGATLIYDPNGSRMILFGGGFGSTYLNDVWALDVSTHAWTQLTPTGAPPSARLFHSAIYDPNSQSMVVFGGYDGSLLNDTWRLSLAGPPTWSPVVTAGVLPAGRYLHSAVFAPGAGMLVFGGSPGADQTWQLTLPSGGGGTPTWSLLPDEFPLQPERESHSAIFDEANDRVVMFGGFVARRAAYPNDVWELPMATLQWRQIAALPSTSSGYPEGRSYHTAVYDPLNQRMVTYGGGRSGILGDTWELPLSGTPRWKALTPPPQVDPVLAYDNSRARLMLLGATTSSGIGLMDVWAYGVVAPSFWTHIAPTGSGPPFRTGASMVYDRTNDRFVFFAGGASLFSPKYNDVWALTIGPPATWTQLFPTGGPPPGRWGHTAVYDSAGGRMLVFGGAGDSSYLDDLWALQLNGPLEWTQHLMPGPGPRWGHAAVFVPIHSANLSAGHMVVFGGGNGAEFLSDTWDWIGSESPTWNALAAGAPPDRYNATAVYDAHRDRMLVWGGYSAGTSTNDLWALPFYNTPGVWSQQFPSGAAPQARSHHGAIYEPIGQRMLVLGGSGFNDLWQLDLAGVELDVPGEPSVVTFRVGAVAPNPAQDQVRLSVEVPQPSLVELAVHDVTGRLMYRSSVHLSAGRHPLEWSGRESRGARAPSGVYLARVRVGASEQVRRFVLLR